MAYTTTQLITSSFYTSGVVSREFETVSGGEITDGLRWLNDVIREKDVDQGMIPYETIYTTNFIQGQVIYTIPNLISIDTIVFYLDQVRYSMNYTKRNEFFGTGRATDVSSLPYEWYFERQFGGGNLYIYFSPDRTYPIEIHGVFRLPNVTLGQDLSLTIDQFYITYLHYALADRICAEYEYDTPIRVMRLLSKYESLINKKSRVLDLKMRKVSTLQNGGSLNWGFINLGKGWTPS